MLKKIKLARGQVKPPGYTGIYLPTNFLVWEGTDTTILDVGYHAAGIVPPGTPDAYDYSDLTTEELAWYIAYTTYTPAQLEEYNSGVSLKWQINIEGN